MKICVSKDIYTSRAQKMIPKTALIESRVVSENRISTINLLDQKAEKAKQAEIEAKATAKAALLDRLGITEDEAKLLLA